MRSRFEDVIERATGRKVIGFMSGNQQDPDLMCEVFILAGSDLLEPWLGLIGVVERSLVPGRPETKWQQHVTRLDPLGCSALERADDLFRRHRTAGCSRNRWDLWELHRGHGLLLTSLGAKPEKSEDAAVTPASSRRTPSVLPSWGDRTGIVDHRARHVSFLAMHRP
jgi:hypothetical protein